ncbi:MAG: hypothetical protein H0U53_10955 [Actinobacteria bacterium]|nr:hypothetical protein [Actinomycetota bacterium]
MRRLYGPNRDAAKELSDIYGALSVIKDAAQEIELIDRLGEMAGTKRPLIKFVALASTIDEIANVLEEKLQELHDQYAIFDYEDE